MYAPFFGLQREPFSIAPDPRFLFMSERHREALAHLLYGVGGGGGFVLLTGEIGAGKTTVCRCFLEQIPPHCAVAYIFNPKLTVPELLQSICDEFRVDVPPQPPGSSGVKGPVDALNGFLLRAHAEGRSAVLIIDEAQSLAPEVLEQLRLLTNLETAERKLLQIILIGQPELREMLARPDLEQLAQRVIARYHLGPLTRDETAAYVRHRLTVAGALAQTPFDGGALAALHRLTGGVPRRINLLADRALLGAYAHQRARVDRRTVEQAAREVFGTAPVVGSSRRWSARLPGGGPGLGAGLALGALLAGGVVWLGWAGAPWGGSGASPAVTLTASGAAATTGGAASAAAGPEAARAAGSAAAPTGGREPGAPGPDAGATATDRATDRTTDRAAGAAVSAAAPSTSSVAELLAAAHADDGTAWRELALRWNVAIGEGDPCVAAAQAQLMCFRSAGGGLPLVRQLARPGLVALRDGNDGTRWALLVALDGEQAQLQVGARRYALSLTALAGIWRGEFATFWRAPADLGGAGADNPALRRWVAAQLTAGGVPEGATLRERVALFQRAQGLPADGVAGPMTLMRLQRQAGSGEPVLEAGG